jgi:hypothetical protein
MTSVQNLANDINRFVTNAGGQPINGLDQMDPAKLAKIRDGLNQFLDNFDQARAQDPALSQIAGGQAVTALRQLAQIASQQQTGAIGGTATAQSLIPGFDPFGQNAISAAPLAASILGNTIAGDGADGNLAELQGLGGGGGTFEDRVFAIMCKVVEDFQKQIEDRLQKLQDEAQQAQNGGGGGGGGKGGGIGGIIGGIAGSVVGGPIGGMIGSKLGGAVGGAVDGGGGGGGSGQNGEESRNIEFEKIKYDMQKLSQMQQAMSNVLDSMNDLAQNAIRKIKGN